MEMKQGKVHPKRLGLVDAYITTTCLIIGSFITMPCYVMPPTSTLTRGIAQPTWVPDIDPWRKIKRDASSRCNSTLESR